MKFTGDISLNAPRAAVFAKLRDARFFASCVEGVQELREIDGDHYTAVLDTKVAYLKFKFNVAVEVARADPPREIEAKIANAGDRALNLELARQLGVAAQVRVGLAVAPDGKSLITSVGDRIPTTRPPSTTTAPMFSGTSPSRPTTRPSVA